MIRAVRSTCIVLALAANAAWSFAVIAQEKEPAPNIPPWRIILQQQLRNEKNCNLNELLYFDEMELGKEIALSGRASCIDGRMFDFSRPRAHQKFEIRLCEPAVC